MSASPSVSSVYAAPQKLEGALYLAISQSGKSPDLVRHAQAATARRRACRRAGQRRGFAACGRRPTASCRCAPDPEISVAATKSYICSLSAILHIAARWNATMPRCATRSFAVPQALRDSWNLDWSPLVDGLADARNLFVVGRGLGLGAAQEAALKLKETCGLHAEAFSAAEVRHGPMAIVGTDFPVLFLTQDDDTIGGTLELAREFRERGAQVWIAAQGDDAACACRSRRRLHPACTPLRDDRQLLSRRERAGAATRTQSGHAAASAQGHGDGVMTTALVNGRVLTADADGCRLRSIRLRRADRRRPHRRRRRGFRSARARAPHARSRRALPRSGFHRLPGQRRRRRAVQRRAERRNASAASARRTHASARPDSCRR